MGTNLSKRRHLSKNNAAKQDDVDGPNICKSIKREHLDETTASAVARDESGKSPKEGLMLGGSIPGADAEARSNIEDQGMPDDAKFIEDGPARTPLFLKYIPESITSTPEVKGIVLNGIEKARCIWMTPKPDSIVIGGYSIKGVNRKPMVWVVNGLYSMTSHEINIAEEVKSGSTVNTELSILHLSGRLDDSVYSVQIDINSNIPTIAEPFGRFEVTDPMHVFRFTKNKYGILCSYPSRIEIFKLKDILIEKSIHSISTIPLDLNELRYEDSVCVTPEMNICVSSYRNNKIYVYDNDGQRLFTLGCGRELFDRVTPHMLFSPVSIQCDEDRRLVICCQPGDIHVYYGEGVWMLARDRVLRTNNDCAVLTENKLWTINYDKLTVYGTAFGQIQQQLK